MSCRYWDTDIDLQNCISFSDLYSAIRICTIPDQSLDGNKDFFVREVVYTELNVSQMVKWISVLYYPFVTIVLLEVGILLLGFCRVFREAHM